MIKKIAKISAACAVALTTVMTNSATVSALENSGYDNVTVKKDEEKVTIGNNAIERSFNIKDSKLTTGTIENKLGKSKFTPAKDSEEFVIRGLQTYERQEPETPLTSVKPTGEASTKTTVSAGSTDTSENLKPEMAIDGDANTYWASTLEGNDSFEINFNEEKTVKSIEYTARFAEQQKYACTGRIDEMVVSVWENDAWKEAGKAKFTYSETGERVVQKIDLNQAYTTTKVQITAPTSYHWDKDHPNSVMNIAEIDVKDENGTSLISKGTTTTSWKITGNSVSTQEGKGYDALIDGDLDTHYHSNYGQGEGEKDKLPVDLTIDRGEDAENNPFQTLGYRPRKENESANGNVKDYEIYVANDKESLFTESNKVKDGTFRYVDVYKEANNPGYIYTSFDEAQTGRYVGFRVKSSTGQNKHAAGTEIDLYKEKFDSVADTVAENGEVKASKLELKDVETSDTSATINGKNKSGKMITFTFKPVQFGKGEMEVTQKVVMYDGDFFMRKFLEIKNSDASDRIDYIDGEHFVTSEGDKTWTIPTNAGGVVQMAKEVSNLGQPFYVNGLFVGSEFPATDTQIVDKLGRTRYYTGKNFDDFKRDNQLTEDGKYVSWQTVVGASHDSGNNTSVIQSDFFNYINSIATPTDFRIQYNSWFDNMMRITDDNILSSFSAVDKHLSDTGVRPLDSYVVDDGWNIYRPSAGALQSQIDIERNGKDDVNTEGFWQFNSKFPNALTPSSQLVQNFGSNFGVWIGPRGGYNYFGELADIIEKAGNGSKAGGSIDVADARYVKKFKEMAIDWMQKYKVNYWKWDGFADQAQFNAFPKGEGIVGYDENHCHMYGGVNGYYHVTDLWEKWIDLFQDVRKAETANGINNLWISLTCYVNPSPWYLQWANSVWIQCVGDRGEVWNSKLNNKSDNMLTYRDACYYDFVVNHQFQFPLANIYNHDPIYGKEGTDINVNSMNGDEFRNYLFMQGTRGTAFWELYYSDSLFDEEKYLINADFLEWAEVNFHMLRNAKMIGGTPASNVGLSSGNSLAAQTQEAYGFACFDGNEGIISMRNPSDSAKTITFGLDEKIGAVNGNYNVSLDHGYVKEGNLGEHKDVYSYGEKVSVTLQPGEVQVWHLSQGKAKKEAKLNTIYTKSNKKVQVRAAAHVDGDAKFTVKVNGKEVKVSKIEKVADLRTFNLTLENGLSDGDVVTVEGLNSSVEMNYYKNGVVAKNDNVSKNGTLSEAARSITGKNGFSVSGKVKTNDRNVVLVQQGEQYKLGIDANGHPYFSVNGVTATSDKVISDANETMITGVRENNGLIKIYVDGEVSKSAYDANSAKTEMTAGEITVNAVNGSFKNVKVYNESLGYDEVEKSSLAELINKIESEKSLYTTDSWTSANMDTLLSNAKTALKGSDEAQKQTAYDELYAGYKKLVPVSTSNLALNKEATANWVDEDSTPVTNSGRPLSVAVDGTVDSNNYAIFGNDNHRAPAYMTVDLGELCNVDQVKLYRYWADKRTYDSTAIVVSETEDFKDAKVLYYSGESDVFKLGQKPNEKLYQETADGKVLYEGESVKARYVRVYGSAVKGNGNENHIVELQVFGSYAENDLYDLASLKELVKEAEKALENKDAYTADSVKALETALNSAKDVIKAVEAGTQEDKTIGYVLNAKDALETALNGLTKKNDPVDKSALKILVEQANAKVEAEYTPESWAGFQTALTNAKAVLENEDATLEQVTDAITTLDSAIKALVEAEKPVDKSELNALIEKASALTKDNYTAESWTVFEESLANAKAIYAKEDATEEEVLNAITELDAAIQALVEVQIPADKTALNALIEKVAGLTKENYTADSWSILESALEEAKKVSANENATEQEISDAISKLESAIKGLVHTPVEPEKPADKTELNDLINKVVGLSKENYTADSWKVLESALEEAKKVNTKEDATAEEVKSAYDALKAAMDGLKKVENNTSNPSTGGSDSNSSKPSDKNNNNANTGLATNLPLFTGGMLASAIGILLIVKNRFFK